MRALIAVKHRASSDILQETLSAWGETHTLTYPRYAADQFLRAIDQGRPYELVSLEEMMADLDGQP